MKVPFVNLQAQLERLKPELLASIEQVIESRDFIQGRYVAEFEKGFARAHGGKHVIGCANGTAALALALRSAGVGDGDEVITVSHTFIATAEAICEVGAKPVLVDIDPDTYTMDVSQVEAVIGKRTRALLPVHLYGNPCDMASLLDVAERHSLRIIEDCAQAHLATYRDRPVGCFGTAGTFSFYPGKNLGAIGDAGCIITDDEEVARRLRKLRDHGRLSKYEHDLVGYNERMDGLQAAVLSVKLKYLDEWTEKRRRNAKAYRERLESVGLKMMTPTGESEPVWHLFIVEVDGRDAVARHLASKGIGTGVHYPVPLHLQPALQHLGYSEGDFPVTEQASHRVLSLPMCAELTEEQIMLVCDELERALAA